MSERRRLPHLIVLGTQKGGTSSLRRLLLDHPGLFMAATKEVHFFSKHWERSADWYARHFRNAPEGVCCGESTPFYLFHQEAPQRIHSLIPQAKLIVLLRDPVERALSQYFHSVRLGLGNLPLAHALAAAPARLLTGDPRHVQEHSYVSRGRYLDQLDRYLRLFPQEQLLVLQSESFFADPTETWRTIERFVGLTPAPCPATKPKFNAGHGEAAAVTDAIRTDLRQQLSATAHGVRQRYGFGWDWA